MGYGFSNKGVDGEGGFLSQLQHLWMSLGLWNPNLQTFANEYSLLELHGHNK